MKKLLSRYQSFFEKNKLGEDLQLTVRVPNPTVEKNEAKILLETLHSIPRNYDTARLFYGEDITPIYEVAVPMVSDYREIVRVSRYFKRYVVGKYDRTLIDGDVTMGSWIGESRPENIRVIPLIEEKEGILNPDDIVSKYVKAEKINDYQRVWFARSDPALNYGNTSTVLMLKVGLHRLQRLSEKLSIDILPMLGCGSAPFRGNFKPTNVDDGLKGYPSVHTFTLQSAFKYDYPIETVQKAVNHLNETKTSAPIDVDEKRSILIVEKLRREYQKMIKLMGPLVNDMAQYVPSRRKRKLHVGLFGYSRKVDGMKLPRAIKFTAALYSYGLPPEILGLHALQGNDLDYVRDVYRNFDSDLRDSMQYFNEDNLSLFPTEIQKRVKDTVSTFDFDVDRRHKKITSIISSNLKDKDYKTLSENVVRAGFIRGFLG